MTAQLSTFQALRFQIADFCPLTSVFGLGLLTSDLWHLIACFSYPKVQGALPSHHPRQMPEFNTEKGMKMNGFILLTLVSLFSASSFDSLGALSYGTVGQSVSQDFDTLAASPATGNTWANDSTLSGWHLFNSANAAVTTYRASSGTDNAGAIYSFGSSSDRALGGVGSSGFAGYIAFAVQNITGGTLGEFTVSFNGEQWRNGGNIAAQPMVLQYGFGASFASVSWVTPGANFDWSSPVATATPAAVDGNSAGRVSNRGGTINNLSWVNNDTLWIRWIEVNDSGNDHGLGIDDFSFTAVPEPTNIALGIFAAGLVAFAWGKKLKHSAKAVSRNSES